eukprot:1189678-Prorocentrum_minimum.AAC.1
MKRQDKTYMGNAWTFYKSSNLFNSDILKSEWPVPSRNAHHASACASPKEATTLRCLQVDGRSEEATDTEDKARHQCYPLEGAT